MVGLSAVGALRPAWERTRELLFRPIVWGRFAVVTFFASLTGIGLSLPDAWTDWVTPASLSHPAEQFDGLRFDPTTRSVVLAVLIVLGISLVIAGLLTIFRLPFMLFDFVSGRRTQFWDSWRANGHAAWDLFLFNLCVGFVAFIPEQIIVRCFHQFVPAGVAAARLAAMGEIVSALAGLLFEILLLGFLVPVLVLEGGTFLEALQKVYDLLSAAPAESLRYLLTVMGLLIVRGFVLGGIFFLELLIFSKAMAPELMRLIQHATSKGMTQLSPLVLLAGFVMLALGVVAAAGYAGLEGTMQIFFEAYTLCFFAKRYPLLKATLDHPQVVGPRVEFGLGLATE